jgi:alpha-galactosidase
MVRTIGLHFHDDAGSPQVLSLDHGVRSERNGIMLSASTEPLPGGGIAHATVENRSTETVRLGCISFELSTGLAAGSPARFFKHGYQSWSNSYPAAVGQAAGHKRRSLFTRLSHQSEVERPDDAPESTTSELFTIVEADSSRERFLAGFAGAAGQFSTLTIVTPDRIIARALLDGVWLRPGEMREADPLAYWRSNLEAAQMAARWAELLGQRMNARVSALYQRGWCSWYHYFDAITEDTLRSNLCRLKEVRREFPLDVVQIDDGFQAALGDWDRTNAKFPSGLKRIADEIRDAGFVAGLWTAPFLAARDSTLMREHPDWLLRDNDGAALRAVHNPSWTADDDKSAYALDPTHPQFTRHLEGLFHRLVDEFGYRYLKLDFLFAAAADGIRHDPNLTRAQALRRGLETIRRAAGDETFILGCGCPLGPAVGVVDGMRIGPDVAPYWGGEVEPGTRLAINAIVSRSFMHRRLWLNDPDCLMLRASETRLSPEERYALAATVAVSGGMLLVSDDMNLLDSESERLFRTAVEIGTDVDSSSAAQPPLATNLMQNTAIKSLTARTSSGALLLLLNMSDSPQIVSTPTVLPIDARARLGGPAGESDAPDQIMLPAHSGRILRY